MENSEYLTMNQAAEFLHIGESTMKMRYKKWRIPYYKIGEKRILFKKNDLIGWIEAGQVISGDADNE